MNTDSHNPRRNHPAPRVFALTPLVILLVSCATPDSGQHAGSATRAETLLAEARHARKPDARIGFALEAADTAAAALPAEDARRTYNAACEEIASEIWKSSDEITLPATITSPAGNYRLEFNTSRRSGVWNPSSFQKLIPTAEIKNQTFVSKEPLSGYGGALVGVSIPPDPRKLFLPGIGVSTAVTAVLSFSKPSQPGEPTRAILTLYDPAKQTSAIIAGTKRSLAADYTAPFGYYPKASDKGFLGMLRPGKYMEQEGFFLVQPYDPDKIPVVFIHGLMSDPQIWLPMMASIESDPELRGRYQFWVFAYPTGNPIAYSALELRNALEAVYRTYPGSKDMVIVNHSLGGDLTHLQVIDSGDVLVDGIFKQNAPKIMALPPDSTVKQGLIFKANPRIERVVFIAVPHRGAPLAINSIGQFGAALIRLPGRVISRIGTATIMEAEEAAGIKKTFIPNSITGLEPDSPLLKSMNKVPIRVPFHSIIGVYGFPKEPLEKTSDTVVPYWSSHLKAAISEKLVPAPHTSIYEHPETIAEVKRILHLNLRTSRR
jgi:pimeloyl-ACP methyl ester carboxylesterase